MRRGRSFERAEHEHDRDTERDEPRLLGERPSAPIVLQLGNEVAGGQVNECPRRQRHEVTRHEAAVDRTFDQMYGQDAHDGG